MVSCRKAVEAFALQCDIFVKIAPDKGALAGPNGFVSDVNEYGLNIYKI